MTIRNATKKDIPRIMDLLLQVGMVHHQGRPDLFYGNATKYTHKELENILAQETTPVFVAVDANDITQGYSFCILQQHCNNHILTDVKTLYIDDLCVDEATRGMGIGRALYDYVVNYAKSIDCYNVTLNVWACNHSALKFYEACGFVPQKIGMETIL